MHYNYEIRNNGYEEVLYLYLTMKYEFSKELTNSNDLGRRTKNFIQNNNIPFHGNKVYLIIDGIVVKILDLSKDNLYPSKSYFSDVFTINIGRKQIVATSKCVVPNRLSRDRDIL